MPGALLPPVANDYRGSRIALWLLGAALLLKTLCSVNALLIGRLIASMHGLHLAALAPDAARIALALLALWALSQLLTALVGWAVLIRYRAFAPTMLAILVLDHLGREILRQLLPVDPTRIPGAGVVNLIILALALAGLPLALRRRGVAAAAPARA
jgi:hypothetical protein